MKAVLGLAVLALVTGCATTPATTPPITDSPAGQATAEPTAEPTGGASSAVPATSEASEPGVQATEAEPRGEVPLSLPPVEKPEPQGGPWDQLSATISDAEQATAATGLPDTFLEYVKARLTVEDDAGCTPSALHFTAAHRDGFVYGSEESPCQDGFAVWGIDGDEWRYLVLFQDPPECAQLTEMGVPVDVPGLACEDENFQVRNY